MEEDMEDMEDMVVATNPMDMEDEHLKLEIATWTGLWMVSNACKDLVSEIKFAMYVQRLLLLECKVSTGKHI
jgi:hypothetical protein